MKKILTTICLFMLTNLSAHTLIMNLLDNEDDTLTIVGQFSTGQNAVDAMVRVEALNTGTLLFQKRLPDEGEVTIPIPLEPYQVVLDGGPGHQLVQDGIPPIKGFKESKINNKTETKELSKAKNSRNTWSLAYIVLISFTLLLLILTIYYSKRNTDKILRSIE